MDDNLNKLVRITDDHVKLSPQLRMRVRLAAQVLSTSMSLAISARNDPEMTETANFCLKFDKWFDCLNGRYLKSEVIKRKPDLAAYKSVDDVRFSWLRTEFLDWLTEWESEIESFPGLTKSERNKFLLSAQTTEGLRITTMAFTSLVKELLGEDGVEFIMPEKLNQDRLEVFFGKLRRSLGDSDNPTVEQARHRILGLLVAGRQVLAPRNTNSVVELDEGNIYLPKRKSYKKL